MEPLQLLEDWRDYWLPGATLEVTAALASFRLAVLPVLLR